MYKKPPTPHFFSQLLAVFLLFLLHLGPLSQASAFEFLPVDKAFQTEVRVSGNELQVYWTVTPGHYLYEHTLGLEVANPGLIQLGPQKLSQKGKAKNDEFMGDVIIHDKNVTLSRTYSFKDQAVGSVQEVDVIASFQGCAEAGLCYLPKTYKTTLAVPVLAADASLATESSSSAPASPNKTKAKAQDNIGENTLLYNLALFFGLGLLLSLTPCVLPMVPILSSIILGSNKTQLSAIRGFGLSTSYVLGMASIYTFAGLLVALSGSRLQIYLQHPMVLWPVASLFVLLAISLFGAFEIRLPSGLHNRLNQLQGKIPGGDYAGVFVIGALSAIVVSPCVTAPLTGILLYIAQEGDAVTGGLSLFALAMGMGAPLIVLGTTGANILPKAGGWMDNVKAFFGFLMLAMAVYMVKHLIPAHLLNVIGGALFAFFGIWLGAMHASSYQSSIQQLFAKAIGIVCLMASAILIYQGSLHYFPSAYKVQQQAEKLVMKKVTTLEELDAALLEAQQQNKFAMVDVYADWCVACLEFEHKTFTVPAVASVMKTMALIKLDITNTPNADEILNNFTIIGPPTIMFYSPAGEELRDLRVSGFMDGDEFLEVLTSVKATAAASK